VTDLVACRGSVRSLAEQAPFKLGAMSPPSKGKHVRLRGPIAATGILGLAVLAAGVAAVWTSVHHARAFWAMTPATTTRIDGTENIFAPPPFGAQPAKTPEQAWPAFFSASGRDNKAAGARVQLGLLTSSIGPYCGVGCDSWTVKDGIAYRALNQLVYGYSWLAFPHRHSRLRDWVFVDANTSKMIIGTVAREPASSVPIGG
jgi:hypothetical protein